MYGQMLMVFRRRQRLYFALTAKLGWLQAIKLEKDKQGMHGNQQIPITPEK